MFVGQNDVDQEWRQGCVRGRLSTMITNELCLEAKKRNQGNSRLACMDIKAEKTGRTRLQLWCWEGKVCSREKNFLGFEKEIFTELQ